MLRRSFLIVAAATCLFVAAPSFAQATFDNTSTTTDTLTSGAPTTSLTHVTTTANGRILLVAVHLNVRNAFGTTVTSITYGGNSLTLLDAITVNNADGNPPNPETRTEVWYLLNPPTGSNTVLMTAGGITPGQTVESVLSATTYSNADQSAPPSATNSGSGSPASVTIAASSATDTILDWVSARETVALTPNGAQTQVYNISTGGSGSDLQTGMSRRSAATPTTNMTWTVSSGFREWEMVAVNIRESIADVEVSESALPDPVIPGDILTYTFYIQNNGPSTATGVTLTDPLPGSVTFVGSSTTLGSCSGTSTVTCNLGTMTLGQTATVTIQVTAPLTGGTIATNTGTVTTTSTDPATPNTASATAYSLVQATVCGTQPGKDGAGGTLAGVVNSYWPGTASAAAGATSITLGTRRGAGISITSGDLILIMQMQDAAINSNNDDRYGDGNGIVGGTTGIGAGYTNANSVGRYEYAVATNTIGAGGGTLTFTGVGAGNGLVYSYTNANATGTQGQRRFQVVRVPQYTTATLGSTVTASAWNGTTGGILAFDVAGDLTLGSATVSVNGLGFRGGAGLQYAGGAGANTDYRGVIGNTTHGIKAEGIAGMPQWVYDSGANLNNGAQGYPNGDFARGAPGNAGGGGTDGHPSANDENSGGGGGANWGRGGTGGNSWNSNLPTGGFGGGPYYDSPGRVVLGGGGGAGSRNNSATVAGAGATGGGMVLVRAGRLTGTATITANGADAYNTTDNDGGGGGGAGGSIVILARGGGIGGLTLRANGGRGGDAWRTQAPGVYPGERHGPGGGGGGGYIAVNGTAASTQVNGGSQGITTTASDTYGAQPGAPGNVVPTALFDQITGIRSGCVDLSVTIGDSPDPVIAGNNITYTEAVTNNSTVVPAQDVTLTQTTPPGTTFVSMTPPAGWSCTTPAVGGTGTIQCTKTTPLAPSTGSGNFTLVVATSPTAADSSTINQTVTTATSSPEPNLANNSATASTTVIRRVDVAVTKVTNDPGPDNVFSQGDTLIYSLTVTNNGPSQASNVVMSDPLPAGFSFSSVVPGSPTCTQSSGTVTCTYATMDPAAVNNITITGTITVNTTQLVNTATTTRNETDTNPANDSATATAFVAAPTVAHMMEMTGAQDGGGDVDVTWTTSFESENLGFNLYRQTSSGREQVNKHLIAGSAFFTNRRELRSGRSYRWKDRVPAGAFAQYYIEDVDLHGQRTMHGPITPSLTSELSSRFTAETNAPALNEIGSVGGIFVSPRGIGAPDDPTGNASNAQQRQQWTIAGQSALKLMVTEEGWYRVSRSDLAALGLDVDDYLALYSQGLKQPLEVDDDGIAFYGIGIDTPATGARAYWLLHDRSPGLRFHPDETKAAKNTAVRTSFTFQRIERTVFFTALTNNGDGENFFGAIVTPAPVTEEVTVENLDSRGGSASLQLVLQGGSDGAHAIRLVLNGHNVGTATLSDLNRKVSTFSIPQAWLSQGSNTLELTALNGETDVSVVESLRLTYPHRLVADDDALKVKVEGGTAVTVDGFTTGDVRAVDVTDPMDPIEIFVRVANGSATFVSPGKGTRSILAIGGTRTRTPSQIVTSTGSNWNGKRNAADMVIIASPSLAAAADPLVARRDGEGIDTVVVDVDDLYDEFNFGQRGPEAIKDFLLQSRSWKHAPKYVLLLGDASFDSRNYLGLGSFDFVPTKLVATSYIKTSSDDWFTDFSGNGVPQLAIGRLPARTLEQAELMIDRIADRDTTGNDRVSFVTDQDPSYDFAAAADTLAARVPGTFPKTFTHSADESTFESLMLAYVGHGSVELWSAGSFGGGAAASLDNAPKFPIVAAMTCLNGYFHDVYMPSLAEDLLTDSDGGAVAVWASSTLTEPAPQMDMADEMFRQLFGGARLGDAAMRAKSATTDGDVRRSWILFGDPSMPLQ